MSLKKLIDQNKPKLPDYSKVISLIEKELKKNRVEAEVVIGGSVAKDTYLKIFDLDIFVRFPKKADSDLLEVILVKAFGRTKIQRVHGSRDYFELNQSSQKYEIVPVVKIKTASQAKNITDVSMLHVDWVRSNLKNPDEVRLAKLFAKAQGLYGAESYISGLSGYILEILIVNYGSFLKMIEEVARWKTKTIIDVAKHYKTNSDILRDINQSKQVSPLIVIDPVDKNRNASASVSEEKYAKFIYAARSFLKKPTEDHFVMQKFSLSNIKRESSFYKSALVLVKFDLMKGKKDIVCSKAFKVFEFLVQKIKFYDFEILKSGIEFDEGLIWFMILPQKLPEYAKITGPLVSVDASFAKNFEEKHENVFLDGSILSSIKKRRFVEPKDLFNFLITDEYVRERLDKVRVG